MNSLGYVAEGLIHKTEKGWFITTDDNIEVSLEEVFAKWEGRRTRLLFANLDILDKLVEMGCQPGQEEEFVGKLEGLNV